MNTEQINQIKQAKAEAEQIYNRIDQIYSELVKQLGFEEYERNCTYGDGDHRDIRGYNPASWLFELVYNVRDINSVDHWIERMLTAKTKYDEFHKNLLESQSQTK